MDDRPFGHNRHGPKIGGCCAPLEGSGTPSNNVAWAEAYFRTNVWHHNPFTRLATIDRAERGGAAVPLFGGS